VRRAIVGTELLRPSHEPNILLTVDSVGKLHLLREFSGAIR
jgi:hypothetical protein